MNEAMADSFQKYIWVCVDCLFALVTRPAFDRARGPNAVPYRAGTSARVLEVEAATARFIDLVPAYIDRGEGSVAFSRLACECCSSPTWGERWRFVMPEELSTSSRHNTDVDDLLALIHREKDENAK